MAMDPTFFFPSLSSFILHFLVSIVSNEMSRNHRLLGGFMQRTEMTQMIHLHIYFLSCLLYQTGMENNASNFIDILTQSKQVF